MSSKMVVVIPPHLPDHLQFTFYAPHLHNINMTTGTFVLFNDHIVGVQEEVGLIVEIKKDGESPEVGQSILSYMILCKRLTFKQGFLWMSFLLSMMLTMRLLKQIYS